MFPGARDVLRFCGSVLLVSGCLLLLDVVLTVTWEEPVTSWLAHREQNKLQHSFGAQRSLAAADIAAAAIVRDPRARLRLLARRAQARARPGSAIGRIRLPSLGRAYYVVEGVDTADLRKGPGHYPTTPFPGEADATVAIAGHRTTYLAPFRTLDRLRRGARVILEMSYARFTYAVTRMRSVAPTDLSVLKNIGAEQLVLTTCDPPFSASHRLVIFARRVSVTVAAA